MQHSHGTLGRGFAPTPKARTIMAAPELHRDAFGRLVLVDAAGGEHVGVAPVRSFPLSDPQRGIALVNAQGQEVCWLDSLDELSVDARTLLEAELAEREFAPVIQRIVSVSSVTEPAEWRVETDRGPTTFVLKTEDQVRRIEPHRALIVDAHGVRYVIPDVRNLDPYSRRVLERYV